MSQSSRKFWESKIIPTVEKLLDREIKSGRPTAKWLTVKQTNWIRDIIRNAGYEAERHMGEFGYHKTAHYFVRIGRANVRLAVSPLNGCGQLSYESEAQVVKREQEFKEQQEKEMAAMLKDYEEKLRSYEHTIENLQSITPSTLKANDDNNFWIEHLTKEVESLKKVITNLKERMGGQS